jgi:hypothetical protein
VPGVISLNLCPAEIHILYAMRMKNANDAEQLNSMWINWMDLAVMEGIG